MFDSIKQGMTQAVNHAEGKDDFIKQHKFDNVDVKNIRAKLNMSQGDFAKTFGINIKSLQNWEQERKHPSGASLVLLKVIDKNPNAVIQALHG